MSSSDEDMYGDGAAPLPAPNPPVKVCDDETALVSETEDEPTQPFDVQPSDIVCEAGAAALPDPDLARFYERLAHSEATHTEMFLNLAAQYFDLEDVSARWLFWLDREAEVLSQVPVLPRLH